MTQEKIFTGNSLLAEFFGFQKTDLGWYDSEEVLNIQGYNTFDSLEFNLSPEWQFAAVKQLSGIIGDLLIEQNNGEHTFWDEWSGMVEDMVYFNDRLMISTNLEDVFLDMVKTVEWYKKVVEKHAITISEIANLSSDIHEILTKYPNFGCIDGDRVWKRWRNDDIDSNFDIELFSEKEDCFGCAFNVDADEIDEWFLNNPDISQDDRELFSELVQSFLANGYKYGQCCSDGTVFNLTKNGCYVYFIIHTDEL